MELRIAGWRYKNIRGGLRDIDIDLGNPPSQWTLVQMPNGTGKTTTMELLRATFTGEPLLPDLVRGFRPADDVELGSFELRLWVNGQLYRLELRLNFRAGTASYWTSRADLVGGGLQEGLLLPEDLKRLLTAAFTRLFVFDGELAKQIRDISKEHAAHAIKTLYRLDRLRVLVQRIKRLVDEEQQRAAGVSSAMETRGITRLRNNYETALETKERLVARRDELQRLEREAETTRRRLEIQISSRMQQDETVRTQMQELAKSREDLEKEILEISKRVLAESRGPAILHPRILGRLRELGGKLDRLKLPRTMSAEFFRELAEQHECVCGRPITEAERKAIIDRAEQYLAENQISVINAMKLAVRDSTANPTELSERVGLLKQKLRERQTLAQRKDRLEADSLAAGGEELRQLRDQLKLAERARDLHAADLERLTTKDSSRQREYSLDWQSNLPLCEAEVESRQDKLATATNTRQFLVQARTTMDAISEIERISLDRLRERVRLATNRKLQALVAGEALQVSRIDGALELSSTGLTTKTAVSEGQSLSVAYAFLTSLFEDAPYRLPFIVDSPAVPLDTAVRREVGELIPGLFDQMVMFVISSEREGFADAFYQREGVRYVTIWRHDENTTEKREGIENFRSFHSREESSVPPADDPDGSARLAPVAS